MRTKYGLNISNRIVSMIFCLKSFFLLFLPIYKNITDLVDLKEVVIFPIFFSLSSILNVDFESIYKPKPNQHFLNPTFVFNDPT